MRLFRAKCTRTRTFFLASTESPKCALTRCGSFFILRFWRAMLGLSKAIFSCMGAQFLNFWCYVACSLWDVWCAKNTVTTMKPSEQCRSIFSTPSREIASCACLRGCIRVKKRVFPVWELNFWCYVACSLWDVWCAKNTVSTVKKLPSEQCRSIFSTPTGE